MQFQGKTNFKKTIKQDYKEMDNQNDAALALHKISGVYLFEEGDKSLGYPVYFQLKKLTCSS